MAGNVRTLIENFITYMRRDEPDLSVLDAHLSRKLELLKKKQDKLAFLEGIRASKKSMDSYYYGKIITFYDIVSELIELYSISASSYTVNINLQDCFIDSDYLSRVLKFPVVAEKYSKTSEGKYIWVGKKSELAGLAHHLLNTGKLKESKIQTSQDLARYFCSFFNVEHDPKDDRTFRPDRALQKVNIFRKI